MPSETEALAAARRRLRETADEIVRLLAEDLSTYPERELQRRFVESEDADGLTDAQIAELRRAARELGRNFADELSRQLAHDEPWLVLAEDAAALPDDRKNLRGVAAVWHDVANIDAQVESLAATFRLPPDGRTPPGYTPPARFIGHRHLPTLVEHYFRSIIELRRMANQARTQDGETRKQGRADRWAAAGESESGA